MRRGDVWTVAGGGDYTGKPRTAVILQDDRLSETGSVTICSFTSDALVLPLFRVAIDFDAGNGLSVPCRAMVDKITTVGRQRLGRQIGTLDPADIVRIERALVVFLGLAGRGVAQEP